MTVDEISIVIALYVIIFLYGIVIGSFLNVCILRTPLRESVAKKRSHCMTCGYQLAWFDLVPLFSYLFLGGKCRKCKAHISIQYPLVEGLNGILYVLIFTMNGWSINSVIYCLFASAALVSLVIDQRTQEIPLGANMFILAVGLVNLGFHLGDWVSYGIGLIAVSVFGVLGYFLFKGQWFNRDERNFMIVTSFLFIWKVEVILLGISLVLYGIGFLLKKKQIIKKELEFGTCVATLSIMMAIASVWIVNIVY